MTLINSGFKDHHTEKTSSKQVPQSSKLVTINVQKQQFKVTKALQNMVNNEYANMKLT